MIVRDQGGGFHDDDVDCPECAAVGVELAEGGMGISIIRAVVDEFRLDQPRRGRHDPHAHQALRRLTRRRRPDDDPALAGLRRAPRRATGGANVTGARGSPASVADADRRRPRASRGRRAAPQARTTSAVRPWADLGSGGGLPGIPAGPGAARRAADADRGRRQEVRLSARGGGAGSGWPAGSTWPARRSEELAAVGGPGRETLRGRARQGGRTACRGRRAGRARC